MGAMMGDVVGAMSEVGVGARTPLEIGTVAVTRLVSKVWSTGLTCGDLLDIRSLLHSVLRVSLCKG